MTLTEFLEARIAEDEAVVTELIADYMSSLMEERKRYGRPEDELTPIAPIETTYDPGQDYSLSPDDYYPLLNVHPARVLAECAAKRGLIDKARWADEAGEDALMTAGEYGRASAFEDVLEWLALPYADHPDYDEAWRM